MLVAACLGAATALNTLAVAGPRANVRYLPVAFLGAALCAAAVREARAGAPAAVVREARAGA